jgi:hypothetical protein
MLGGTPLRGPISCVGSSPVPAGAAGPDARPAAAPGPSAVPPSWLLDPAARSAGVAGSASGRPAAGGESEAAPEGEAPTGEEDTSRGGELAGVELVCTDEPPRRCAWDLGN